jgi:hypothetical protein
MTMSGTSVSVLVPTFNRAHYLGECLDSLLAQSVPPREIVVIDDGSEDATPEIVRAYGERIRYVRKENGGKPRAVNLGLSLAGGDLIWIFDDDDVALPDAIETRLAALHANPGAAFVYAPHYYGHDGPDGRIVRGCLHALPAHDPDRFFHDLMLGCFFHLATALVPAALYRELGGFDTELLSSEDYDMQLRLARAYPAVQSTAPVFVFRQHTGPRGAKAIRYSGTQRSRVFRRFDQRVGQKLRASLQLGDYLVPRQAGPLDPVAMRAARLERLAVMAGKGCLAEFFTDLGELLADLRPGEGLGEGERRAISGAVRGGYADAAILDEWPLVVDYVHGLRHHRCHGAAVRAMAHGFLTLAAGYPGSAGERLKRLGVSLRLLALSR